MILKAIIKKTANQMKVWDAKPANLCQAVKIE